MAENVAVAQRLIDALAAVDREALAATLAPRVRLRALLPGRSVDLTGRDAVCAEMLGWFAGVPEVALESREVGEVGGLVRFGFRFALRGGDLGEQVVEQHAFAAVSGGEVTTLRVLCSGFRPLPVAERQLDALGAGCATLTPLIAAALRDLDSGQVLAVMTDDPAAREGITSWSRLTGHDVVAAVAEPGGTRFYLRHS